MHSTKMVDMPDEDINSYVARGCTYGGISEPSHNAQKEQMNETKSKLVFYPASITRSGRHR